jgi:hypothetical protein
VDYADSLELLVRLVFELPDSSDDDLAIALRTSGLTESVAERVVAFGTLAFGRVILSSPLLPRLSISEHYVILDPDTGASVRGVIAIDPIFVAAVRYAQSHTSDRRWAKVAARSAELKNLSDALDAKGPEGVDGGTMSEPIFLRIPMSSGKSRNPWQRAMDSIRRNRR